jgi:2-C-methyl-D-erythritol 4-phosphate cytidylyltransferase/2-C-methyl-D-erythritol 2,4-cyclodiphosphate synthase
MNCGSMNCASADAPLVGIKKEYRVLNLGDKGRTLTVLGAVVKTFLSVKRISQIVITYPAGKENAEGEAKAALEKSVLCNDKLFFTEGGASRQLSVYNALCSLEAVDYVLVHDGARPWASASLIEAVIDAALRHGAAIPLLEATETPKICADGFVTAHPSRKTVFFAQTPQCFAFKPLFEAQTKALEASNNGRAFTDDGEIWNFAYPERPIAAVHGDKANKKITFAEDLE